MRKYFRSLFLLLYITLLMTSPARAQTAASAQSSTDLLANLPDSELIIYVNPSRIINDAMPRLVPEKNLQELRSGIESIKDFTKIDLRNMEFFVVAMRFNKPAAGMLFPIPDAMFAARGDFDAKALIAMAMTVSGGKLREEAYGSHSINLLKLSDVSDSASKNPLGAAFSEIAIAALDSSTIAIGNASYIKAALDAADGRGRMNPTKIEALLRTPDALISIAGSPLLAFANSFALTMAKDRDRNLDMHRFGDYYASLSIDGQNLKLTGTMNADNPETAVIVKNMLSGTLEQAKTFVTDKNAQSIFSEIKLIAEGSEVTLQARIPQEMAARFVRELFAPKPPPTTSVAAEKKETVQTGSVTPPVKPKAKSRRSRRVK